MDYPYDVGPYSRTITTSSPDAQLWFDRGLNWIFGFHHEEAIECFKRALAADPDCAMAHWGVAYAVGPNYNYPWELHDPATKARSLGRAFDATQSALALVDRVTPPERTLIEALRARYPQRDPIEDQAPWNEAFTDVMRAAHRAYPADLDIASVFAEAILNRTPWQMWDLRSGAPAEGAGTIEARDLLEGAFRLLPAAMRHPGLLHLYVHLMEMSGTPEAALLAGDALRELCPDMGHLVHMPTHIDIQCGHYRDAMLWNQKAVIADRKYYEREGGMNFYTGYRIHNLHFAAYGAMFLGQFGPALAAVDELVATVPEALLRVESPPMADFLESYIAVRPHVFVRFGKWFELTLEPMPADPGLYQMTTATLHYAKGVAHAALGNVAAAEKEQEKFHAVVARISPSRHLHNVTAAQQFAVAAEMLAGEIDYRKGAYDSAFAHLREAVAREDALPYDEPWGWMQPVRHALGALLLEQGRADEAEIVYREDLGLGGALPRAQIHPDNVWALRGLLDCLERRGETAEARLIRQRLAYASARADTPVHVSCMCARG